MRECGLCGGSGKHSFHKCPECLGFGFVDDPEESDDPDDEYEPDEDECRQCGPREVAEGRCECTRQVYASPLRRSGGQS